MNSHARLTLADLPTSPRMSTEPEMQSTGTTHLRAPSPPPVQSSPATDRRTQALPRSPRTAPLHGRDRRERELHTACGWTGTARWLSLQLAPIKLPLPKRSTPQRERECACEAQLGSLAKREDSSRWFRWFLLFPLLFCTTFLQVFLFKTNYFLFYFYSLIYFIYLSISFANSFSRTFSFTGSSSISQVLTDSWSKFSDFKFSLIIKYKINFYIIFKTFQLFLAVSPMALQCGWFSTRQTSKLAKPMTRRGNVPLCPPSRYSLTSSPSSCHAIDSRYFYLIIKVNNHPKKSPFYVADEYFFWHGWVQCGLNY